MIIFCLSEEEIFSVPTLHPTLQETRMIHPEKRHFIIVAKTLGIQVLLFVGILFTVWGSQKLYTLIDPVKFPVYQAEIKDNMTEQEKLNSLLSQKMNELDERERTINELQDMINAQTERVQNLLNSVKDALLGFSSDELTVREKDGKVYVAMSDKLLFESGSARVDKRGKEALAKLAEVLNKQSDIDVYIEGHTDSKPINTAQFKDNWDLSVIRATSVVRILTKDYGVKPLQIQPCGRGEFMPVADNETADGRAKNRRTEIIMAPKLDKLYQMLNQ